MNNRIHTARVCALILAGGRSSRMGTDKPMLSIGGQTMLERAVLFWRSVPEVGSVLVAGGTEAHFSELPSGAVSIPDLYPGSGPMAGLHAAFALTDAAVLYVSAVDMPFLRKDALLPVPDADASVYRKDGFPEPLFGVYRRSCLSAIEECLSSGNPRMTDLLGMVRTEYVPLPDTLQNTVDNLNSPADYLRALAGTPPLLAFTGWSGSGKTTFLEKLLPVLIARGLRVSVIKHDGHGFDMDRPGKDTYRFAAAGAVATAIAGPNGWAVLSSEKTDALALRDKLPPCDLILAEGLKYADIPKIEVHRAATGKPFVCRDRTLLAAVTDEKIDGISVPQLGLEDTEPCADLILRTFLPGTADT